MGLLGPLPVMVTQKKGNSLLPFFIAVYLSSKDKKKWQKLKHQEVIQLKFLSEKEKVVNPLNLTTNTIEVKEIIVDKAGN